VGRHDHRSRNKGPQDRFGVVGSSDQGEDILGALDLGTNNCRLLIARPQGEGFRVIDAFSRIVRLGEGLSQSAALNDAAMDRTISALKVCAEKMRRRDVTLSRQVATQACRQATNCEMFLDRVRRETGLELEIITNTEEAELALAGCVPLFDPQISNAIVFDIGGGSTELAWMRNDEGCEGGRVEVMSMPVGVVTLTEQYGGDVFDEGTYERMVVETSNRLAWFEQKHDILAHIDAGSVQMVGTSGTVTTLAGVQLNLPRYIRDRVDGLFMNFDQLRLVAKHLASVGFEERAAFPCIGRERADLVVAGCAILEAICRQWPVGQLRVADRGVREGILFGLLKRVA
jgi:exopolyphosphatase/guanosine-5'-triphosphate,3'-diphosphate pyrophosphatase